MVAGHKISAAVRGGSRLPRRGHRRRVGLHARD